MTSNDIQRCSVLQRTPSLQTFRHVFKSIQASTELPQEEKPLNYPTLIEQKEKVFAQSGVTGFRQCFFEVRKYCPKALQSSKTTPRFTQRLPFTVPSETSGLLSLPELSIATGIRFAYA
jgi:hypothetical protein